MTRSPSIRGFIAELKRRHVFRVATVYLVAAWAIIQVATTVFPVLGLPQWAVTAAVVTAIAGFPITLVVAWALDLTAEGVEVTDQPGRRLRAPWLRATVAIITIAIAGAGGYALFLNIKPSDAAPTPSVAVFPFTAESGTSVEYLREGIVNLLSTSFNGIGSMRSVDPTTLLNSLSQRERADVTPATAERVAKKVGATAYIIGQISGTPDDITLTATMYDLGSKAAPSAVSVSGNEADILDRIDKLTGLLLTGRMHDQASRLSKIAALTTDKLSALKNYLMGEAEYREARWPTAMSFFERAVGEDSTFALANYRLAVAADWASKFDTARSALDRALRSSQRLTAHDRELLIAFNYALRGQPDEAEAAYKQITENYPDDVEAWYRYGEVLYHYNPPRGRSVFESEPVFERAVHGAPDVEPMVLHLMELALYRKDYTRFDEFAKSIDRSKPAALRRIAIRDYETGDAARKQQIEASLVGAHAGDVLFVATGLAQFSHDLDGAARIANLLTDDTSAYVRGTAHLALAQYAVARNNWVAARKELQSVAAVSPAYAIEHEALWRSLPFMSTPVDSLKALRARLEAWHPAPGDSIHKPNVYLGAHNGVHGLLRDYLLGVLSARLHDGAGVEASVQALTASNDTAHRALAQRLATAVRAHDAFARGDYAGTVALLSHTRVTADLDLVYNSVFWNGAYERYLRAEALHALHRDAEAKPWYQSLREGRNEIVFYNAARE